MIYVYDNLVDNYLLESLYNKYINQPFKYYHKSNTTQNFYHWNHVEIDSSGSNVNDISDKLELYEAELFKTVIKKIHKDCDLLRVYSNAYTFGTEGFPHTDSNRFGEETFILYLNKTWLPEWGGETVVFDNTNTDIEKAVLPKFGRIIRFPSNRLHVARSISKWCTELRIVLVYKIKLYEACHTYLKSVNAYDIPHSGRNLGTHLWGVYNLLKKENNTEDVCLAGLFHSIYGTNKFKTVCETNRNTIKNLIGEKAEFLVWVFCNSMLRPNWNSNIVLLKDNSIITISQEDLKMLQIIEQANFKEQRST